MSDETRRDKVHIVILLVADLTKFHGATSGNYKGNEVQIFTSHNICFIIVDD